MEVVVDEKTASIQSGWIRRASTGQVSQRIWQISPMDFSNGIVMPALSVRARSEKDESVVSSFEIATLQEAEFNLVLPKDAFLLSVPKNTILVDFRKNPSDPPREFARQEIADVGTYVDSSGFAKNTNAPLPSTDASRHQDRPRIVVYLLGIALLLSLMLVLRSYLLKLRKAS
jgi:hypothetical protein